jgi:ATP-independent RNA helicase DbpA
MTTAFRDVGLRDDLLLALDNLGYAEMTPIQAAALPPVLAGRDVVGQAKTGSGKTAAFGLGLLQRLDPTLLVCQALVLCPTRELADQVAGELRRLAQRTANVRIRTLCGGRQLREQRLALSQGVHIVVGTPGRVADHLRRGTLDVSTLRTLVLDEADRMLDMGFIEEVQGIVDDCPPERQTLLFSATFPDQIAELSATTQRDPVRVAVEAQVAVDQLQQFVFRCERAQRKERVTELLAAYRPSSCLVFCETQRDCEQMADFLWNRGASALALHGGLEQRDRDAVMLQFANGSATVLVATNVAARGLDIPALPAVIVAELGGEPEGHVHRVGRTGRAGEQGVALSIVCGPAEERRLAAIEALTGRSIPEGPEPTAGVSVQFLASELQTVLILSGKRDKIRKGDVLGALIKDAGLPADSIGRIDLQARVTAVAMKREVAEQAIRYLKKGRVKSKRVRAILLDG